MLEAKDLEMIAQIVTKAVEEVNRGNAETQRIEKIVYDNMKAIRRILDEEIMKGIHIIAEGNGDLRHRMNQILESHAEQELLRLRIRNLESEIRYIKDHLEIA